MNLRTERLQFQVLEAAKAVVRVLDTESSDLTIALDHLWCTVIALEKDEKKKK